MTHEEFEYLDERLKRIRLNPDIINTDITQMDLLVGLVNEYAEKYFDIESRVCDNCKHQTDSSLCNAGVVYDNYMDRDTFGCNKFERKVESK